MREEGSRRAGRGVHLPRPAVVVSVLLVALVAGLILVDRSAPAEAGGRAAHYLPGDGAAALYLDQDGTEQVIEHARFVGPIGVLTSPDTVSAAVLAALSDEETQRVQVWREVTTDATGAQFTDLYTLDENGVGEVAAWGGDVGFLFDPALPVLPADVAPGSRWSGSGSALGDDVLTYTAEYEAEAASEEVPLADGGSLAVGDDCLLVRGRLVITQTGEGDLVVNEGEAVWCPGRGRLVSQGVQNGIPVSAVAVPDGVPTPMRATASDDASSTVRTTPDGASLQPVHTDPFFGESARTASIPLAPVTTEDGLVATANDNGDDIHAWRFVGDRADLVWSGHPGGTIVRLSTVGELTFAATSGRDVAAYDGLGRRLWTWHGDDLVLAPVVAADPGDPAGDVLVATRGGRVVRLDRSTGVARWEMQVGADARSSLAVAGGILVVGDERGRVSGIDVADGAVRWQEDIGTVQEVAAPVQGDGLVFVVTVDPTVTALDPATGEELWSAYLSGIVRAVSADEEAVIIAGDERTISFTADDGREAWSGPGAEHAAVLTGADRKAALALVLDDELLLAGERGASWPLPPELSAAVTPYPVMVGGDLILLDSFLGAWRLGER